MSETAEIVRIELHQAILEVVRKRVNTQAQAEHVMKRLVPQIEELSGHVWIQCDWAKENR